MQVPFDDNLVPLMPASFETLRNREFVPEHGLTGLKLLREKAGKERDLRELYRGRAPYELLQNADDAGATVAIFALFSDGMAFAHNGRWFTVGNFRSLADGWSDKDPNECIGHKGLGFRSVLDITPSPHLLKIDHNYFGVKFGWAINHNHIQQVFASNHDLKRLYDSWTKNGQRACPVMYIPRNAKRESLGGGLTALNRYLADDSHKLTTLFWFPSRDAELPAAIQEELSIEPLTSGAVGRDRIRQFLTGEADVVLPFLRSIRTVLLTDGKAILGRADLQVISKSGIAQRIKVATEYESSPTQTREFFEMSYICPIPPAVRNAPGTPKAVKHLREAALKLAVRIEEGQPQPEPSACFHVYFPTEDRTGFGFLVHGDFHVEPHRKHLVSGEYNRWLLREAARHAANEFLTSLLVEYRPGAVFAALAPGLSIGENSESFSQAFAKALSGRSAPFIPVSAGNALPKDVVLAPSTDMAEFWETRFASVLSEIQPTKESFVSNEHDWTPSRSFMKFAGVEALPRDSLVTLVECAGKVGQAADWWYDCYSQIANDEALTRYERAKFIGRNLIPSLGGNILPVPDDDGLLVCVSPNHAETISKVPALFSGTFAFVDSNLSQLIEDGPDEISAWILNRFHISRFEASELIPRAIRAAAPKLFDGSLKTGVSELIDAWRFIKELSEKGRSILSDDFWNTVGRFPVVASTANLDSPIVHTHLIPCLATYWPDELLGERAALKGVKSIRRIHPGFVQKLCGGDASSSWLQFLLRSGVSRSPKMLRYSRLAAGTEELFVRRDDPSVYADFNGERAHDVNKLAADSVSRGSTWPRYADAVSDCGHKAPRVIQTLSVLDGFDEVCDLAAHEFRHGDESWADRLKQLVAEMPDTEEYGDTVYCRGGRVGGHPTTTRNYARLQLATSGWLPSSAGPEALGRCFLRRSAYKLVSDTRAGESINDLLLPSVIVDDLEAFVRLQKLGVAALEDATASSETLTAALEQIGIRMSFPEMAGWIFENNARWRAVRGAIQDTYRSLNQRDDLGDRIKGLKFATRRSEGIVFASLPLYYAEPGPVRDAFIDALPLIDADRNFAAFFEHIGVTQLTPGLTVIEELHNQGETVPNPGLKAEIVEGLSPYLLALLQSKNDSPPDEQRVRRTLTERFSVLNSPQLRVTFALASNASVPHVSSPLLPFYLQRKIHERSGAVNEAHYVLFVAAGSKPQFKDLDADALGTVLVPMFQDRAAADLIAMFARVAVRFKETGGDVPAMRDFMYSHLGVSMEVLENVSEPEPERPTTAATMAPPPPAIIIGSTSDEGAQPTLADLMQAKQEDLQDQAISLIGKIAHLGQSKSGGGGGVRTVGPVPAPISPEQSARGVAGEEEIMRRLKRPGGWEGFTFSRDVRAENCGFDVDAQQGDRHVKLEVKTFLQGGRVIVTSRELQASAEFKNDYYLVGVLDNDSSEHDRWKTFLIRDPLRYLLSLGQFIVDAKLQVNADELFEFKTGTAVPNAS